MPIFLQDCGYVGTFFLNAVYGGLGTIRSSVRAVVRPGLRCLQDDAFELDKVRSRL